eukprot:7379817-Prymnesium_polylepis.3
MWGFLNGGSRLYVGLEAAAATMIRSRRVTDHVEPVADIDERMRRGPVEHHQRSILSVDSAGPYDADLGNGHHGLSPTSSLPGAGNMTPASWGVVDPKTNV